MNDQDLNGIYSTKVYIFNSHRSNFLTIHIFSGSSNSVMETLTHHSRLLKPSPSAALILKYYQFKSSFRGTRRVINKRSPLFGSIYLVLGSLSCRSFAWISSIIFVVRRRTFDETWKKENTQRGVSDHVEKGEERKKLILPVESSLQNTRYSEEVGFRSKRLYLHAKPWERQVALRP